MDHKETANIVVEQRIGKFPFPKQVEEIHEKGNQRISAGLRELLGNGETVSTRVTAS